MWSRFARRVRPQHVSANRCSLFPRRGRRTSLITMVVSPPMVRLPSGPVTRPTRRPSRSLVTSRPWRESRDWRLRRPSRHAAARPARTVGHALAVCALGEPSARAGRVTLRRGRITVPISVVFVTLVLPKPGRPRRRRSVVHAAAAAPPAGGRQMPSLPFITWRPCYRRAGRMGIREHRGWF